MKKTEQEISFFISLFVACCFIFGDIKTRRWLMYGEKRQVYFDSSMIVLSIYVHLTFMPSNLKHHFTLLIFPYKSPLLINGKNKTTRRQHRRYWKRLFILLFSSIWFLRVFITFSCEGTRGEGEEAWKKMKKKNKNCTFS